MRRNNVAIPLFRFEKKIWMGDEGVRAYTAYWKYRMTVSWSVFIAVTLNLNWAHSAMPYRHFNSLTKMQKVDLFSVNSNIYCDAKQTNKLPLNDSTSKLKEGGQHIFCDFWGICLIGCVKPKNRFKKNFCICKSFNIKISSMLYYFNFINNWLDLPISIS